jgi:hypothetical protein
MIPSDCMISVTLPCYEKSDPQSIPVQDANRHDESRYQDFDGPLSARNPRHRQRRPT